MIDLSRVSKYYVACGYTDLRRGIDGLAAMVIQQFGKELLEENAALEQEVEELRRWEHERASRKDFIFTAKNPLIPPGIRGFF